MDNIFDKIKFVDNKENYESIDDYNDDNDDEIKKNNDDETKKSNDDETKKSNRPKCLSCKWCGIYIPKRYVTTALTAVGMLFVYSMRTNLGVTVITILDHSSYKKVHEDAIKNVSSITTSSSRNTFRQGRLHNIILHRPPCKALHWGPCLHNHSQE